jgi:cellulose biosynthesis protein BcsQ
VLTIEDIKEECAKWQIPAPEMKIILNKYSPSKKASQEAWELLINEFHGMVLPFQIRESADLQNTINNGMSVFDATSPKVVKDAITMLADHICPLMNKKGNENNDASTLKTVQ